MGVERAFFGDRRDVHETDNVFPWTTIIDGEKYGIEHEDRVVKILENAGLWDDEIALTLTSDATIISNGKNIDGVKKALSEANVTHYEAFNGIVVPLKKPSSTNS